MITLAVIWIAWCTMHSLLISQSAHKLGERILGSNLHLYRLLYVGFSVFTLVPVLWYQFTLPENILVGSSWIWRTAQAVLLFYAGFMFYAGARVYDMGYFLGLSQWQNFRKQMESENLPFHSDGILSYVRHPWYSGGIALLWGIGSCTEIYLLSRTILTAYILLGTVLEETRLKRELGEQYIAYCRRVPMLIPWKIKPGTEGQGNVS